MTKTDITRGLNCLKRYGWIVKTFNSNRYAMTGSKGFPDHCLINAAKKRLVFIEVKLGKDKVSEDQATTLQALRDVGAEVIIFPNDECKGIQDLQDIFFA